jgi:copper resistance protein C
MMKHEFWNPVRGAHLFMASAALVLLTVFLIPTSGLHAHPESEGAVAPPSAEALHLSLRATIPAADSTVNQSPEEIRLIFSEAPQLDGTRIRVLNDAEELVPTTDATADPDDAKEVFVVPEAALANGTYTVAWRTIAQDGHAQNGSFEFMVQSGQ